MFPVVSTVSHQAVPRFSDSRVALASGVRVRESQLHAKSNPVTQAVQTWEGRVSRTGQLMDWLRLAFSPKPLSVFHGGLVLEPNGQFSPKSLLIQGDTIRRVSDKLPTLAFYVRQKLGRTTHVTAVTGQLITPGLIDQHTHGAFGKDYMESSPADVQALLKRLPRYGVTSVLATLVSAPTAKIKEAMYMVEGLMSAPQPKSTRVLGMHLEGPFINKDYRGAHVPQFIQPISQPAFQLAGLLSPGLRLVTLAPELDADFALTRFLTAKGVRVSAGHTGASFAQMQQAQQAGLSGVTHLFNTMPALNHRQPGVVGAALTMPGLKSEIIADGHHVDPTLVSMVARLRPRDTILVSDSMCLAGMPDGSKQHFAGQDVHVQNGCVRNAEGAIAGSSAILGQTVKLMTRQGLTSFATAIQMASQNSADFLGLMNVGRLAPRALADFVVWDPKSLAIKATYIGGQKAY